MKRIERRAVSQVYSTREDTSFIENDRFSRADEPIDLAFSISTLVSPRFLSRRKHPGVDVGPWHCYVSDNVLACLFPRPARPRGNKASETTSGLAALLCRSTWRVISQESDRPSRALVDSSATNWRLCPLDMKGKNSGVRNSIVYELSQRTSMM